MAYIEGIDRYQAVLTDFVSLDNSISDDNYVRVIDAFVDSLDLASLGFILHSANSRGQKPYKTSVLLKIHMYCFFNGIQSSRKQERECYRNIELRWLTGFLVPDHSTLANFCKDNSSAIKSIFKEFSKLCIKLNLFDFKLFAIDGSKFKAYCSKKQAFTIDKLNLLLDEIDEKINLYISKLDSDSSLDDDSRKVFKRKLDLIKERKVKYSSLKDLMTKEYINEICLTDPDAKVMKNHSEIEPCYNVQAVVDSKHKLIVDFDVSRQANDVGLLKPMAEKVINDYNLMDNSSNEDIDNNNENDVNSTSDTDTNTDNDNDISFLADAGYYKASDLLALNTGRLHALVPKPNCAKLSSSNDLDFSKSNFTYDVSNDFYLCPMGKKLTFSRISTETRNGVKSKYKIYVCNDCAKCKHSKDCTKSVNGRSIKRNVKEDKLDEINALYKSDSSFYHLRKELVEHPFGTIKRNLGFTHMYVKGIERVSSWTSSVFLTYNLKRVINILGVPKMLEAIAT